ncbi:Pantothenate kinase [Tolypocladium paradoxum]|uniref:Pantothenate kinase n=1 Tax=Tolypocladium paradoxum TaxID=94208 RepID=A0A2S4L937_9HYPO|nr:Pantothenate kinase [Tolypocladium paradoxum]
MNLGQREGAELSISHETDTVHLHPPLRAAPLRARGLISLIVVIPPLYSDSFVVETQAPGRFDAPPQRVANGLRVSMTPAVGDHEKAAAADERRDQRRGVERPRQRPRTMTSTEEIDNTITRPGSVRINVKGAFIVDPDTSTPALGNGQQGNGRASPTHHETSDIRLPNHTAVVSHIAVDIGGSLIKLVYFSREAHSKEPGGRLNFQSFETDRVDDCVELMKHLRDKQLELSGSQPGELCVMATGGGAYKFYDKIREALGVDVLREDEMECLIIGLDFFITEIPREVFTYSETDPMHFVNPPETISPYLLVNIGSGVSFLKVTGPRSYQRVGGTSLGGGTLWGLLSLLTGARTFDEMLDQAGHGDNTKVDMLVGDIYGTDYDKIGLKNTTIASSFGKVFRMKNAAEAAAASGPDGAAGGSPMPASAGFTDGDISRSLLYAISNNIGQIAYLQSQIHNLSDIYFGGSFIRGHRQTMNTLSYAIKFWSKGEKQAYFLRHEGYLGAVGAFLKRQPKNWGRRGSLEGMDQLLELRTSVKAKEGLAT